MSFLSFNEITTKQIEEGVELKAVSGDAMTMVMFYISFSVQWIMVLGDFLGCSPSKESHLPYFL